MNSIKEFNYKMKHSQAMPNGYYKCMSLGKRFYFLYTNMRISKPKSFLCALLLISLTVDKDS